MPEPDANKLKLALVYDDRYLDHDTRAGHPERPDRLRAVTRQLAADKLLGDERVVQVKPRAATSVELKRIHAQRYIDRAVSTCEAGREYLDSLDTPVGEQSESIARLAAGASLKALDAIMAGTYRRAFCVVRPPGHHAEHKQAMGFCIYNNVAVAAAHLIDRHKLERVAVVDFDVHHGNGTQHSFEDRADVLFCSSHEHPRYQYPGTGFEKEIGTGKGEGFTLNTPLMPKTGDTEARAAYTQKILPKIDAYKPQFLLISAGFDAEAADPLGNLRWTPDTFDWITRELCKLADKHCEGRVLSTLEGGYDLDSLGRCASAHLRAMLETA